MSADRFKIQTVGKAFRGEEEIDGMADVVLVRNTPALPCTSSILMICSTPPWRAGERRGLTSWKTEASWECLA